MLNGEINELELKTSKVTYDYYVIPQVLVYMEGHGSLGDRINHFVLKDELPVVVVCEIVPVVHHKLNLRKIMVICKK